MADALSEDGLDIGAERSTRVVRKRVTTHVGAGGLRDTEDIRPLLDLLPEVLWVKCGVALTPCQWDRDRGGLGITTYAVPCQN